MKRVEFSKQFEKNGSTSTVITNKPRRRLDLFPRLVCIFLALIIWLYCVNVTQAEVEATITVKLEIVGAENMSDGMQIYSEQNPEVTFRVKGKERDITKYTSLDYRAYIDVSKIDSVGWQPLTIVIVTPKVRVLNFQDWKYFFEFLPNQNLKSYNQWLNSQQYPLQNFYIDIRFQSYPIRPLESLASHLHKYY